MSDPFGKTDRATTRSIEHTYVERVYDRTVIRSKEAQMSAMPTEVMPTAAESRPVPAALAPTVVRPREAVLRVIPSAGQRTRSGQRARTAGGRAHPTGVRACSAALRATPSTAVPGAAPATAVLVIPQGGPSGT